MADTARNKVFVASVVVALQIHDVTVWIRFDGGLDRGSGIAVGTKRWESRLKPKLPLVEERTILFFRRRQLPEGAIEPPSRV